MTDPTTPTPPATEGQAGSGELALLVSLLNDVYTDEGVFIWLYSVNRNLDGRTPFDLWVNGDRQKVMREAHRISDRPDAQPPAPAHDTTVGQAGSGERIRVTNGVVAIYRPDQGSPPYWPPIRNPWHCYNTYDGSFIECRTDEDVARYRELPAAQPPAPVHDGFGEEYWRGHSAGRSEERERLEPSEDDRAALTDLIRNGLLGDDGIGVQYPRTDDGLPRDLARWIIDAGWRKPGSDDTAEVLAGLVEEMTALAGEYQAQAMRGYGYRTETAAGVRMARRMVEAAQARPPVDTIAALRAERDEARGLLDEAMSKLPVNGFSNDELGDPWVRWAERVQEKRRTW